MRHALDEARKGEGATRPNPPVGSVIVMAGRIVGRGYHHKAGGPHAEIHALRDAGSSAKGAALYVTLEPCCTHGRTPPCTDAILAAGIKTVVYAVDDPNPAHVGRARRILQKHGVTVRTGACHREAMEVLGPFAKWITTRLPYVTLKLAMSFDGRIADSTYRSKWITSAPARECVQALRHRVDAIMVGVTTAAKDDPGLMVNDGTRRPYRVIVDSKGRTKFSARILNDELATQTVIATTAACPPSRVNAYRRKGATVLTCKSTRGRVALGDLFSQLGNMGILHVLCEGGGELAGSLIREGYVDDLVLFYGPLLLGGDGKPGVAGAGWMLKNAPRLTVTHVEQLGPDVVVRAQVKK